MYSLVMMMALSNGAEAPKFFLDGCFGGCHSYTCNGCYGCHSYGCHGCFGRRLFGWAHWNNCCGCNGYVNYGCNGAVAPQQGKGKDADDMPEDVDEPKDNDKKSSLEFAPAILVVTLPADAKLMIDDVAKKSSSTVRTFASPPLKRGEEFHYNLKAEVVRDGKTVTASSRVAVRAGETSRVTLDLPQTVAAR